MALTWRPPGIAVPDVEGGEGFRRVSGAGCFRLGGNGVGLGFREVWSCGWKQRSGGMRFSASFSRPRNHQREVDEPKLEGGLYRPFADLVVRELGRRSDVSPLLLKDEFRDMSSRDGSTMIENKAFASTKIRYFRSTYINAGPSMQVLNVAGFSRPEYDIPIFCADFFSTATRNIIVLDLNPLYSTSTDKLYKERYYGNLMALANKHAKVLPWGDKLTAESMQFFSPLVLWTKAQGQDLSKTLYPAFQDYLLAWLNILDIAQPSADPVATAKNQEAQHRYLIWRATKDPGRALLTRLYGEELSERFIEEYLFHGVKALGSKSFLDYFPEYRTEDNTISKQRSMLGKSFATRPWDEHGNLCLNFGTVTSSPTVRTRPPIG